MSIARVEAFPLRYVDPNDAGRHRYVTLARIENADGAVGWGEAVTQPPETALATKLIVEQGLAPLLTGRDERDVRTLWEAVRHHGFWAGHGGVFTFAASAVDTALWDLAGKVAGVPVHALIGSKVHDRLRACLSVIWDTEDLDRTQAQFGAAVEHGYTAVKGGWGLNHAASFGLDPERDVRVVAAVREAIGPQTYFAADVSALAAWSSGHAIRMARRFEELGLSCLEDPLPAHDYDGYARLRRQTSLPIATGEREWTVEGYQRLVRAEAVDVILIDPGRAEGLTGMKLAADHARTHRVTVVPHSWSSAVNTAAAVHVLATCPNLHVFELKELPTPVTHELVSRPFVQRDGYVEVPMEPGLGIEVDEEAVRRLAYGG